MHSIKPFDARPQGQNHLCILRRGVGRWWTSISIWTAADSRHLAASLLGHYPFTRVQKWGSASPKIQSAWAFNPQWSQWQGPTTKANSNCVSQLARAFVVRLGVRIRVDFMNTVRLGFGPKMGPKFN